MNQIIMGARSVDCRSCKNKSEDCSPKKCDVYIPRGTVYITNAFSLGMLPEGKYNRMVVFDTTIEEIWTDPKGKIGSAYAEEVVSAVGHQATAEIFSAVLGVHIPMNRIQISLKEGDIVIVGQLKERLPEGKVLSIQEMAEMPISWKVIKLLEDEDTL